MTTPFSVGHLCFIQQIFIVYRALFKVLEFNKQTKIPSILVTFLFPRYSSLQLLTCPVTNSGAIACSTFFNFSPTSKSVQLNLSTEGQGPHQALGIQKTNEMQCLASGAHDPSGETNAFKLITEQF